MVVERERERERDMGREAGGRSEQNRVPGQAWAPVVGRQPLRPPTRTRQGGEILLMCLTVPAVRLLRRSDKTPNKEL